MYLGSDGVTRHTIHDVRERLEAIVKILKGHVNAEPILAVMKIAALVLLACLGFAVGGYGGTQSRSWTCPFRP